MNLFLKGDSVINKLSRSKYIPLVAFIVAFFEATISPILPEAFLLVVLAYRKDISWKFLSLLTALGSACGALVMYLLGVTLYSSYGQAVLKVLHGEAIANEAERLFINNAFMAQFVASLTPLPDRVFSFLAGAFLVSPLVVFVATFLARLIRASIVAYLSYEYGDEARVYIKRHTRFFMLTVVAVIVVYVVYNYVIIK
jgi:membrane protein YqaA with SNARE-associated domain